jgi:hypothetical protein
LSRKYLAYIALLAGWLIFCYWLYAKEIYPRLHEPKGLKWPVFDQQLDMPLAFLWGSDIPHAGAGFENWVDTLKKIDSAQHFLIFRSSYFRDEAGSIEKGKELARKRVDRMVEYLGLSKNRIMIEVIPADIKADARSHPIESVTYDVMSIHDIMNLTSDTLEVCFPLRDSLGLPYQVVESLDEWLEKRSDKKSDTIYLIGIADGSGISESADIAWERANSIKKKVLQHGWDENMIRMNTGQRNQSNAVRNRCVVIYFE